jgi:hypothetical protein
MEVSPVIDFIVSFVISNPKLAGFCTVAYLVGLGAKLSREAIENYDLLSPSKKDDEKLEEIKKGKPYKYVSLVLDILFRLKKPEK